MPKKVKEPEKFDPQTALRYNEWVYDMLKMEEALTQTIHSMIAYRTTIGPWNEEDVKDGWRVLRGIVEAKEKKLKNG